MALLFWEHMEKPGKKTDLGVGWIRWIVDIEQGKMPLGLPEELVTHCLGSLGLPEELVTHCLGTLLPLSLI